VFLVQLKALGYNRFLDESKYYFDSDGETLTQRVDPPYVLHTFDHVLIGIQSETKNTRDRVVLELLRLSKLSDISSFESAEKEAQKALAEIIPKI